MSIAAGLFVVHEGDASNEHLRHGRHRAVKRAEGHQTRAAVHDYGAEACLGRQIPGQG